jgi:hypothetical protein
VIVVCGSQPTILDRVWRTTFDFKSPFRLKMNLVCLESFYVSFEVTDHALFTVYVDITASECP